MTVCWFAQATAPDERHQRIDDRLLLRPEGVIAAHVFTPGATHDPYLNDGTPPDLALQVYFRDIHALEAALAPDGIYTIGLPLALGNDFTHQAMLVRSFAVPDPTPRDDRGACTYLVAYEGKAGDLPSWLRTYISGHAPIMTRFPRVRTVEIYTRIDWIESMPTWGRADHMQRNKIVFDDAAALTAALNSPVRHEMRADFAKLPPFTGPVSHFPMKTRILHGRVRSIHA